MVTYDARPSAFTQLTTTGEWEYILSALGTRSRRVEGSAMNPSLDTGGRNAVIADGIAVIKGQLWRCDAPVSTPVPAASAQNRIDRLVLRLTRGASSSPTVVVPTVITGTPSGTPVEPPLTQTPTGIYDIPVFSWTSTSAGAITTLGWGVGSRAMGRWRPLTGSMSGTNTGYAPPQYKFSDDLKWVEIAGYVQTPAATGNYNGTVFKTLPANYQPVTTQGHKWLVTLVADGPFGTPMVSVLPSGAVQFELADLASPDHSGYRRPVPARGSGRVRQS